MGRTTLREKNMDAIEFWQQVQALLDPEHKHKIFYRVYYDDSGTVLFYTMEDLPGNYLEIDQETFARSDGNLKVIKGKLVKPSVSLSQKLVPSDQGTACHQNNVAIIASSAQAKFWNLKYYDQDS